MGSSLTRWERILYIIILVLALFSRFYMLEDRAISHDESIHTKFSWNLFNGDGFQHNPMMHGPLLFEVTALNYHLFGANDFTSRLFVALAGVALVITPLLFRRWLGRTGALAVSLLLLISPTISYYSRYIRHDALLMLTAVLLLWAILQYLETGWHRWLVWLAAFFSLMYATKEASYIYTAIFGVLLFLPFVIQVISAPWQNPRLYRPFVGLLLAALAFGLLFAISAAGAPSAEIPLDPGGETSVSDVAMPLWGQISATIALAAAGGAVIVVFYGVGAATMRRLRLFDVLMVVGTLTLPLGAAFIIRFAAGVDMQLIYDAVRTGNFSAIPAPVVTIIFAVTLATLAASAAFGLWWDARRWPKIALVHYAIFLVLYTTVFTWGFGALSGLLGGLAYWLAQHGVKRGNQPGYYYLMIGSLYEYLPILLSMAGGVAALLVGITRQAWRQDSEARPDGKPGLPEWDWNRILPLFLLGWTALSWIAYTAAGEKMPWLTVHIALPSAFLGGWALGRLVDAVAWREVMARRGWYFLLALSLTIAALVVFSSGIGALRLASEGGVSAAGPSLAQLRPQGQVLAGVLGLLLFGGGLAWSAQQLGGRRSLQLLGVLGVVALSAVTVRTMVLANYVNYDLATEFLVYAHGTPDIKVALEQIEEVSWRTTGTAHDVKVAYGEDGSWPFTWYMVDFPNNYFYGKTPDPSQLLASPVVIAGSPEYDAVEAILGSDYVYYEYLYLWWPIQDYYGLTWDRVWNAVSNPEMRAALWDIAWQRDYDAFATVKNAEAPFDLKSWPYRKDFRLYVQREIAQEVWPYRTPADTARAAKPVETPAPDPFAAGSRELVREVEISMPGAVVRGIAPAGDGTYYVTDTANHRLIHVGPEGPIDSFGGYGSGPGLFMEPWDLAIDADGNLYVADTWNHRIQKFDASRRHLASWGQYAQVTDAGDPGSAGLFYGPRALALSPDGRELYVADTGNKRIQVFSTDGTFLRAFGGAGSAAGQLQEPVGIDVNEEGLVAVADTWNQRVQIFDERGTPLRQWDVPTWDTTNPDLKPFLTWHGDTLYVADSLQHRVLAFDTSGTFEWALGSSAGTGLSFPQGLRVVEGTLYVTDAHTGLLTGFELP